MPKAIVHTACLLGALGVMSFLVTLDQGQQAHSSLEHCPWAADALALYHRIPRQPRNNAPYDIKQSHYDPGHALDPSLIAQIEHDRKHHAKPGADVWLDSEVTFTMPVADTRTLPLAIKSEESAGTLQVEIQTSAGLELISTQQSRTIDLTQQNTIEIPVTVYGAGEGEQFVHLFVSRIDEHGNSSYRALATAVQVGDLEATAMHYKHSQKSHQNAPVRVLSAQESIY